MGLRNLKKTHKKQLKTAAASQKPRPSHLYGKQNLSPRTCLRCDKTFQSYGPQNRMCDGCLAFAEKSSNDMI